MARYDTVLIDPGPDALERALREAVTAANDRRRQRLVAWPLPGHAGLAGELAAKPQGWRQWNGGDGRPGEARSAVALAWWSDLVGRKHHRVAGRRGPFSRPMLHNMLCPFGEPRPPLWFVYPDHVFLQRDGERRVACALCACGEFGTPEQLGWMGTCCDACHDRREDGQIASPAWLDPRRATLRGEEGRLLFLRYAPDGATLAGGTGREQVTLWDTATGRERCRLTTGAQEWVLDVGWADAGRALLTGAANGRVRRWDAATGQEQSAVDVPGAADCFAAAPDGACFARGNRQGASVWADGQARPMSGDVGGVSHLAFSPDGTLLAGTTREGHVCLWDCTTGTPRGRLDSPEAPALGLAFAPDGRTLAVGLAPRAGEGPPGRGLILLCDVPSGAVRASLPGHAGGTRCVAFAPDGRALASGGDDGLVKLWDVAAGRERVTVEWHLDHVCSVAFAPDGLTLASGSFDGTAKLWPREALRPLERAGARPALRPASG